MPWKSGNTTKQGFCPEDLVERQILQCTLGWDIFLMAVLAPGKAQFNQRDGIGSNRGLWKSENLWKSRPNKSAGEKSRLQWTQLGKPFSHPDFHLMLSCAFFFPPVLCFQEKRSNWNKLKIRFHEKVGAQAISCPLIPPSSLQDCPAKMTLRGPCWNKKARASLKGVQQQEFYGADCPLTRKHKLDPLWNASFFFPRSYWKQLSNYAAWHLNTVPSPHNPSLLLCKKQWKGFARGYFSLSSHRQGGTGMCLSSGLHRAERGKLQTSWMSFLCVFCSPQRPVATFPSIVIRFSQTSGFSFLFFFFFKSRDLFWKLEFLTHKTICGGIQPSTQKLEIG